MILVKKSIKPTDFERKLRENFYNSFKIFLRINQFFCTAPINLNFLQNEVESRKRVDKFRKILHFMWATLMAGSVIIATYRQHSDFDEKSLEFITKMLYIGEYSIGTMNLCLVFVSCQYQKCRYVKYFQKLINVDLNLLKCGIQPNYGRVFKYLMISMFFYTIFFVVVIFTDFFYNKMDVPSFFRSSTVYTIPNIVGILALTQYSLVLFVIQEKLRAINSTLIRFVRQTEAHMTNKFHISHFVPQDFREKEFGMDNTIEILRKQHSDLSRLVESLNESFGILILSTIVASYIILSIQFYAFYKMSEGYFDEDDIWLTTYTILWVILHGGKMVLILYPINNVTDQQNETGKILFKLNLCSNDLSEGVKNMIKSFSQQLLHEKTPPNACRIVNLDLTLLSTLIGALTTYLVILIQFDAAARESTKSNNATLTCSTNK